MTYRLWMVAKSPPILDGGNPINHGINHLSTGAGFLPSTVLHITMFKFARDLNRIDFQRLPHMTNIAHWPDVFGNGQVGQVFFSLDYQVTTEPSLMRLVYVGLLERLRVM